MPLDSALIKILQCPDCQGKIGYKSKPEKLWCIKCQRVFQIKNSIPVMLPKNLKTV